MKAYKMLKMSQTSPITPNLIQGVIRRTFLWNIKLLVQAIKRGFKNWNRPFWRRGRGRHRWRWRGCRWAHPPHQSKSASHHHMNLMMRWLAQTVAPPGQSTPANIYHFIFLFYIYIPPGQSMHYRLSSIKGVRFRFANFASHFIRIQIFQIDFTLILSTSKYFR